MSPQRLRRPRSDTVAAERRQSSCPEEPFLVDLPPTLAPYNDIVSAMEGFLQAQHVTEIWHCFSALQSLATGRNGNADDFYRNLKNHVSPHLNFKLNGIFRALDAKIAERGSSTAPHGLYDKRPLRGSRTVICGGGPVGLRLAVELRLLGATVVLCEKREGFSRSNVLHIWDFVLHDLLALGAKVLYPRFGSAASFLHIGTRQLQATLLKVSLLLGVDVRFGVELVGIEAAKETPERSPPAEEPRSTASSSAVVSVPSWVRQTASAKPLLPSTAVIPKAPPPSWHVRLRGAGVRPGTANPNPGGADAGNSGELLPCDAFIDASGPRSAVSTKQAGFVYQEVYTAEAVGLVVNFEHCGTRLEQHLQEFSWAKQFNFELFDRLKEEADLDLENAVYYQGETHYFVVTPRRHNLIARGVLMPESPERRRQATDGSRGNPYTPRGGANMSVLDPQNSRICQAKLCRYARSIADFFGVPRSCKFVGAPQLFDFSSRRSSTEAVRLLSPPPGGPRQQLPRPLPMFVVGDALLEPFWPEGLGVVRGFLGALDTAWVLAACPGCVGAGAGSAEETTTPPAPPGTEAAAAAAAAAAADLAADASAAELVSSRQRLLTVLRQLSGFTRDRVLLDRSKDFGLDPRTRYRHHLLI